MVALQLESIDLDMKMNFSVLSVLTLVLICAFYSEITVDARPGASKFVACFYVAYSVDLFYDIVGFGFIPDWERL